MAAMTGSFSAAEGRRRFAGPAVAAVPAQQQQRSVAATGSVKHAATMTEKMLARASEKDKVRPGENVWVNADVLMTHDVGGPGTIGIFKKEFGSNAKVWDREKIVLIPDHYIFTQDERANRNVDILRDFAQEQGIKYFYDITDRSDFRVNPQYRGVCHVALAQEGHCRPGEVLFGTDSHTCNAGAFGQFATGIGHTDAGFVMGTGKLLLKVPPTLRFVLDGEMPPYLLAKDLILEIIGEISVSGATYRAMEFMGTAVEQMTMEDRMTLCNMVVEAGGKNGVVAADTVTFSYLKGKTGPLQHEPVYSDENASFLREYRFDVSKLEPVVAKPHSPDNRALARECKDVKIDRVYIGSCTGGKTEDFVAAAKILHKSRQKVKVPTFLVPATQQVWMDLYALPVPEAEGKTCAEIFQAAGCDTPAAPSCGACLGGPKDSYARMNEPKVSTVPDFISWLFMESKELALRLRYAFLQPTATSPVEWATKRVKFTWRPRTRLRLPHSLASSATPGTSSRSPVETNALLVIRVYTHYHGDEFRRLNKLCAGKSAAQVTSREQDLP